MSSRIYMKCSNDLSAKENINELADSTVQERNNQMKTYSNINRIMKTKFKNINVKLSTSESDKTKTTRISMNEIIESSSSSDEILQTRYSINNSTIFPTDEYHSNDCSPIFMGRTSDKESISESNLNTKTSPIIIQATAYNENKDFNDLNSDQIMPDVKQTEEIATNSPNVGINSYYLGVTTNYSDDIESNSIPIANENRDEQFDFKEISDDIVKDFINGSFDATRYQLKKPLVSGQSEKQYMAIMQEIINTQNTRGRNSNNKKSCIKKAKTAPKLPRTVKKSKESVQKKLDNNEVNSKVFSKGKEKRTKQGNKTKDIFDYKEQDLTLKRKNYSPNKTPPKTKNISQKKCKDDSIIIIESPDRSSIPTRYSKRKLRNSSLVASKKIREIEQLENMPDSCEEIIYSNDEINYTYKPCKYSNSNNILTGKANELKKKQDIMLNIVKNKVQSETASEENEEANDASNYFRWEEMKNITPTSYKKTLFQNPLKAFDQSESLSRKDKFKRNYFPNLISFQKYFTSGTNSDLGEDLKNGFEDKTTNYNLKDISYAKNETEPTNSKNINSFNDTKRESKHKTWESLERDLLKELDEMPHVDNICKTVILQEEEVIRKKEVANDTNLLTVSNTSMLQTIQKYIRSNKYNMHYEIKNTESKIYESKAEKIPYQLRNRVSAPYSNETEPISKSISILDKTIAAMEECTKNLSLPQVNIFEQKESNSQFEDATDNSDANHETQFHTSVTFKSKNKKQYYSNEIIGYMKKSKRNSKKINFKQSNVTTLVKNLRNEPNEHEASDCGDFNDAEQSGQSISVNKNYLFENPPKKSLYEVKSQALVPNSDGKHNPWSILMDKLDVSDNYEEDNNKHMIPDSGHTCKTDKNVKKTIFEPFITESYTKQSLKDTYHTDKTVILVDDDETMKIHERTLKKQGELKEIGHKSVEPLVSEVDGYESIDFEERSILYETEVSNNVAQEKNIKKDDKNEKNQERKPLKETEINEKSVPKQYEEKIPKRSPKYKLRIDRDGSLKIKHSNESSSVSNSSQDFKESRKTSASDLKSHKHGHITNNKREKYTRYLKRILDKQALLVTEEKTDGRTKSEDEQPKNVSKESENVSKENENVSKENPNQDRNNQQLTRVKLIAENDDDIFSLSSSDSETSSKM